MSREIDLGISPSGSEAWAVPNLAQVPVNFHVKKSTAKLGTDTNEAILAIPDATF
jgi:hypothetical protein